MASLFSSCAAFASAACCAASAPNRSASLPACAISAWAGSWGSWGSNGDPMGTQGDGGDGLEFLRGNLWKSGGTRSYHKIMKTWCVFMWFMWLTPLTPFKMEHGWHGQLLTTKGAMVHEQTKVFGLVAQMNLKTKKIGKVFLHKHFQEHLAQNLNKKHWCGCKISWCCWCWAIDFLKLSSMKKYGFRPSMVYLSTCWPANHQVL